jgi:hemoglobin
VGQTIFVKLGGFSAVSAIVMDFYEQVLDSDIVGDFFENTDMDKQIDHQTKFISSLLGGPASYTNEQLKKVHKHLHVMPEHYEEILILLDRALEKNGVTADDRQFVANEMESRRMFILEH